MLAQFTSWLLGLVSQWFKDFWTFIQDGALWVWDGVLGAVSSLVQSIAVPDWMSQGLGTLFSQVDPSILYFVGLTGLPQALSIIGAAYVFKVLRKFATLFLW